MKKDQKGSPRRYEEREDGKEDKKDCEGWEEGKEKKEERTGREGGRMKKVEEGRSTSLLFKRRNEIVCFTRVFQTLGRQKSLADGENGIVKKKLLKSSGSLEWEVRTSKIEETQHKT